jgi:GTPase SAR1 family protein
MSYPDTDVFLVCFSVVDPESFKNALSVWLPEVRENAPDAQYILCGTKFDLREDGQTIDELHRSGQDSIPTDIGSLAAKECGCAGYIECSAKQMRGIRAVPSSAISVAVQRYSQHNSEAVKTRGCKTQ